MAVVGGLCAVVAAFAMIGWNAIITEKRRRERLLHRRRRSQRRTTGRLVAAAAQTHAQALESPSRDAREAHDTRGAREAREKHLAGALPLLISAATAAVASTTSLSKDSLSNNTTGKKLAIEDGRGEEGGAPAGKWQGGKLDREEEEGDEGRGELRLPRTPCTAPCSSERCPVSPAFYQPPPTSRRQSMSPTVMSPTILSPMVSPPPSPPLGGMAEGDAGPVFHDLVLILDAPALPPPPRKLPNLPEEMDPSAEAAKVPSVLSPWKGCDLSPGFHLSAPWSPPPRRGVPRRNSRGNRPRTFSEYSAGPSSSSGGDGGGSGGGVSSSPPLTHRGRTVSVSSGLAAALSSGMGSDSGGGGVDGGGCGGGGRARGASYGDGDPFADLNLGPFDDESWSMGGGAPPAPRMRRRRSVGGGGPSRPLYPHAREVLPV